MEHDKMGAKRPTLPRRSVATALKGLNPLLRRLLHPSDPAGGANLNPLGERLREAELVQLNVKNMGYEIGRALVQENLSAAGEMVPAPVYVGLGSKATTQQDIESSWLWHWCQRLNTAVIYHRKVWEFAYTLQVLWENGMLEPGKRAIGFGCGEEPIPSLLASLGVEVTITDQNSDTAKKQGWAQTSQFTETLDSAFREELVDRETFNRLANLRYVDMNAIDNDLSDYDFCWSICAFEHLGSITKGQKFVTNAMQVLKPGGIAVHTTEFNFTSDGPTIDDAPTVLFQKKDFEEIGAALRDAGDMPAEMNFDIGNGPIDNFIDVPPYYYTIKNLEDKDTRVNHLKMSLSGYPTTCFGLWARRGQYRA